MIHAILESGYRLAQFVQITKNICKIDLKTIILFNQFQKS